jgi:uncharacterized protein (DUF2249 family)
MSDKVVTLDVREELHGGRDPFERIMQTVGRLDADEGLLLIAPFEPVPLVRLLARQGFSARASRLGHTDWQVLFRRRVRPATPPETVEAPAPDPAHATGDVIEVDARGLEPPQPLVTILEALATLPAGSVLRALTDRRPLHLYPQLEDRGFTGTTEELADGSFVTFIRSR